MSETKFTPAPWQVHDEGDALWIAPPDLQANVICDIVGRDSFGHKNVHTDEDFSNAWLIAAAPEMFKSLHGMVELVKMLMRENEIHLTHDDLNELEKAAGVIAKARGETLNRLIAEETVNQPQG